MQPNNSRADGVDSLSQLVQHPVWSSVRVPGSEPDPYAQSSAQSCVQSSNNSSLQSYHTAPNAGQSNTSSQTYYSADLSPSHPTTNSASTRSSNISDPYSPAYSARSINSCKSRKNVLYRRRAHPIPVPVSLGLFSSTPPEDLIWQVRCLYMTSLQRTDTGLGSAGRALLRSAGLHGDFSQPVPLWIDEEIRCCAELFIALTREVLLKDAIGVVSTHWKGPVSSCIR
ncbi:hypothetical protein EDB84DRAFT_1518058, partial [Lactarius hengduanensis]